MPTRVERHLQRAVRNQRLASNCLDPNHDLKALPPDWVVVLIFYAAVQYVSAYFQHVEGAVPTSHMAREKAMDKDVVLKPIRTHYDYLQDQSENARYDAVYQVSRADVATMLNSRLAAIEAHIRAKLPP